MVNLSPSFLVQIEKFVKFISFHLVPGWCPAEPALSPGDPAPPRCEPRAPGGGAAFGGGGRRGESEGSGRTGLRYG